MPKQEQITITVNDVEVRKRIAGIRNAAVSDGVKQVAGRAASNTIKGHLRGLDASRPNRLGGRRGHFYSKAANSTHFKVTANGARVSVTHTGFALRYYGGVVRPVRAKALAIPARKELYGYWPREVDADMFVLWRPGKNIGALVTKLGGSLRVLYWLVHKATIRPDKSLLPHPDVIGSAVNRAVTSFLDRATAPGVPGAPQ